MNFSTKLQQIDQTLIKLLGERISILETIGAPSMQEQLASYKALLMESGVSESAWISIMTSCMAALASASPLCHETTSRRITVVGGRGLMGRFFVERFSAAGHQVSILEYDGWNRAKQLLGHADLVLICVPLKNTLEVIQRVAPYLSPAAILADIASTKTAVVQAMLENHSGPVVGLHPMFGPGVKSFLGQKVVVCPGRAPMSFQWLLDLLQADGANLITSTPAEHDRMMVVVQAIRFFSNFSLATFLADEGVDIQRSLEFASPLYRTEVNTVSRLVAQDAALYVDILMASEERCEAIRRFATTCDHLARLLEHGNRAGLIAEFEAARETFRADSQRAFQESDHTINSLSLFLVANALEEKEEQFLSAA